jgi:hypothetical protein
MRIETSGRVKMKDDPGRGTPVSVVVDGDRLTIDLIGDWSQSELGITSLSEGFAIRAEGEEIVLVTDNDAALAEALGMASLNPRLARKVAASHPPEDRPLATEDDLGEAKPSNVPAIGLAVSGVLMALGGFMVRSLEAPVGIEAFQGPTLDDPSRFWLAFVIGGFLMGVVGFAVAIGRRSARWLSLLVLGAMVIFLVQAGQEVSNETGHLIAYGVVAGGIVVGVAIVFSGSLSGEN